MHRRILRVDFRRTTRPLAALVVLAAMLAMTGAAVVAQQRRALKDAFEDDFRIGAALTPGQFTEQNAREAALVKTQFNTISPENVLKWEALHPRPERYNFELSDRYVLFGEQNHMFIVGHTLVWHNQTPKWVFEDSPGHPANPETVLKRMEEHIHTVVGRYRGRVNGWDVVNEALDEQGGMRQTPWLKMIGPDYIAKAFQLAHQADPKAELYYNDYNLENEAKRKGALELLGKLKAQGVPLSGVGMQGHYHMDAPSEEQVDAAIGAFSKLGLKVMITELDVDVLPEAFKYIGAEVTLSAELQPELNPYPQGLPEALQQGLAERYAKLFGVFLKHRGEITRVTFWGVTDAESWLNNWPVKGRTNYPLLFDREGKAKPAFEAVLRSKQEVTK